MASGSPTGEPALDLTTQHSVTARRFPPPSSIGQHVLRGLLIALMFPGYLIWDLAKYCNSQEGRFAKISMFVVLSPIFGFSALVWFGLWALIVGLLWVAVQGA
jgi:hypothetical protein